MVSASSLLARMCVRTCRSFGDLRIAPKHCNDTTRGNGQGTVNSSGSRLRSAAAVFCMSTSTSN
eukprot:4634786-Prymnesium_polylepis.1